MSEAGSVLILDHIRRSFHQGDTVLEVLKGAELAIETGEIVGLVGPSGAGKSTLLQIAGLLERPDGGDVLLDGDSCGARDDAGRTALRRSYLGFVYQFHHLLPEFTAAENVMLPQMVAGKAKGAARERAIALLADVGLENRAGHLPSELSGGEQQRVAIIRALANGPKMLLADEPTGNLDEQTARVVFDMLKETVAASGIAALIATHNTELAAKMDRVVRLQEGVLV